MTTPVPDWFLHGTVDTFTSKILHHVSRSSPTFASSAACHFLRVPLEIRHEIYRYLLLDPPAAFLDPSYDEKTFNEMMEDEHQ